MPVLRNVLATLVLGAIFVWTTPAQAAFLFCNKTKVVIEAAFGHHDEGVWASSGWWQLQPGQCARVYGKPLTQRFYFYYARSLAVENSAEPMIWSGKYAFCTGAKAFNVQGDSGCEQRGYQTKGFQEVDIGLHQSDYTLNFEDPRIR